MKYYNSLECDCDPYGTTDGGVCDSYSDPEEDPPLVAGQCHCKKFVEVPRCDKCINGYWNFSEENPDGCIGWCIWHINIKNIFFIVLALCNIEVIF